MRNAECGMRNAECGMRNAECGMRNAECGMLNAECGMRNAECGMRNQECLMRNAECGLRNAECGMRNAELLNLDNLLNPQSNSAFRIHTSLAPFKSPARSLMPTPGPPGIDIFPFLTVIGGSNQFPYFSVPNLYS